MSADAIAWVDGEFVTGPAISPFDRAFSAGLGLLETMGAVGGRLPLWERHMARLGASAPGLGIPCSLPRNLPRAAEELLRRAGRPDGVLRLVLTAGTEAAGRPGLCMTTRARIVAPGPLRLRVARARRHPGDPTAAVKSTSRLYYELAMAEARAAGADDALILSTGGEVLETSTANVFCRLDGELCTPRANGAFLAGVARAVLLDGLRAAGTAVKERDLRLDDLHRAAGIWVTNAVYGPRGAVLAAEPAVHAAEPAVHAAEPAVHAAEPAPAAEAAGVEGSDRGPLAEVWLRAIGRARSDELP